MSSIAVWFVLMSLGLAQATPIAEDTCIAQLLTPSSSCWNSIIVPRSCQSATINLGTTDLKACAAVGLMWSYPTNNLTITIETSFTEQAHAYSIDIDNSQIKDYTIRIYRVRDGQEVEIKSTDDRIVLNSDANYQIILKFQGPPSIFYYGFPLSYTVVKA